jgi:hypothetical protein
MKRLQIIVWVALSGMLLAQPAFAQDATALQRELLYRVAQGSGEDVALLLPHTGNANAVNALGQPLLTIAASRTDAQALPVIEALVAKGADMNAGGAGKHYPLIAAIQAGNAAVVDYLLKAGADYRVTDESGISAAHYGQKSPYPRVVEVISEQLEKDAAYLESLTSAQGHQLHRYNLAYHACGLQYHSFYYGSGMDVIDADEQTQTLAEHQRVIRESMGYLAQFFQYNPKQLTYIYYEGKALIFDELETMVSNRHRRANGVGQDSDMQRRCDPIAKTLLTAPLDEDTISRAERRRTNR